VEALLASQAAGERFRALAIGVGPFLKVGLCRSRSSAICLLFGLQPFITLRRRLFKQCVRADLATQPFFHDL
jgi:hypothetical protein